MRLKAWRRCANAFHTAHPQARFSLAERIKRFIPSEALEQDLNDIPDSEVKNQPSIQTNQPATFIDKDEFKIYQGSLASHWEAVSRAEKCVDRLELKNACLALASLPIQSLFSAMGDRIFPRIAAGPLGKLGITEFLFELHRKSAALCAQLMQEFPELEMHANNKEFEFVERLLLMDHLTAERLDLAVQMWNQELHFPQLLSNQKIDPWLKVHCMSRLTPKPFSRWLKSYNSHFGGSCLALLLNLAPQHVDAIGHELQGQSLEIIERVCKAVRTPEQFRVCRLLLKRNTPGPLGVVLLKTALRLKQSYDIASICKRWAPDLRSEVSLLAEAVLATAFAQKRPQADAPVSAPQQFLHSFLVARVLSPLECDADALNTVVGVAATRLYNRHPQKVPGAVFWQLVMSLPHHEAEIPIGGLAQRSLARLLVRRPFIEQLRYISLPVVTSHGVMDVLRRHIAKIADYRRVNMVDPHTMQAEEDVQFLVAGLILASEKSAAGKSTNTDAVTVLFEQWSKDTADTMVEEVASNAQQYQDLLRPLTFPVIARLIDHKNFVVAFQLLRAAGAASFSARTLDTLLVALASDHPEQAYRFLVWLVRDEQAKVSPATLNRMLVLVARSPLLTESQLMNRFQSLREILGSHTHQRVSRDSAAELVEAFLRSALKRGGGSRRRLQWAFDVAQRAGVEDEQFAVWAKTLDFMQNNKQAYWAE